MKENPAGRVSDINFKTLTAKLHLLEGQNDKASDCADDALALTNDATTVFEIRRLALLLSELKRFEDASSRSGSGLPFQTRLVPIQYIFYNVQTG